MKSTIPFLETGLRPQFYVHGTANEIPNSDSTDPSLGDYETVEEIIIIDNQVDILNPILEIL